MPAPLSAQACARAGTSPGSASAASSQRRPSRQCPRKSQNAHQRPGQPLRPRRIPARHRPAERRAQVVVLRRHPGMPLPPASRASCRLGLRQRDEIVGVPSVCRIGLPVGHQTLLGVLADRLQHPVARSALRLRLGHDQRLVYQPPQQFEDRPRPRPRPRRRPPRRLPASSPPRRPRGGRRAPAPLRRAARSSSRALRASRAGAAADCARRPSAPGAGGRGAPAAPPGASSFDPRRRQLDRQRQSVEAGADRRDRDRHSHQ